MHKFQYSFLYLKLDDFEYHIKLCHTLIILSRLLACFVHAVFLVYQTVYLILIWVQVLNGLLSRDNQKEGISIPIGIIPAGSDNSLVWTVLGVRDPVSAAMAIVKVM